jgi:hypothetical protein
MSVEDALTMLDSRIPLTAGERRMIVNGLYNLAFKAGVDSERNRLRQIAASERSFGHRDFASHIEQAVNTTADAVAEYEDTTTAIRRGLEAKQRNKIDGRYPN